MLQVILLEEGTQGLQERLIHIGEEAAQRGAVGQLLAAKERQEGTGKGQKTLEKRFERRLSTDGIALQARLQNRSPRSVQHVLARGAPVHTAHRGSHGAQGVGHIR